MCNPTLAISALTAGMSYQQSITQQKYAEMQANRQNEIALANLEYRRKASSLKLRQSTEKNLAKLKEAEQRKKTASHGSTVDRKNMVNSRNHLQNKSKLR